MSTDIKERKSAPLSCSELRHLFTSNESFTHIADLVDLTTQDDTREVAETELAELPLHEKRRYVGFFEDVALTLYSGLVSTEIADYMFGYYARACWDSRAFWSGEMGNKAHPYWMLFAVFCRDMTKQQEQFESSCTNDDYVRNTFRFSRTR